MSRKTTLNEIADAAGVSIATVDRVINGRGGVSRRAEARVLEWANKLNLDRIAYRRHMRSLRIAVLVPPPFDPFFIRMRDSFVRANTVMAEVKITSFLHYIDRSDVPGIRDKLAEVTKSYDGIILCAPADETLSALVRKVAATVPLVTLVTDLPDTGRLAYVGPDNYRMGRVAGELMGRFLGHDGGEILSITGLQSQQDQSDRQRGFSAVLAERFPKARIVDSFEMYDNPERAAMLTLKSLSAHPLTRGIYNPTAGNAGVRKAIESLDIKHEIVIITHELTPERRQLLAAGKLDAVIDQNPDIEARKALEILAQYYGRHTSDVDETHTPFSLFVRENT